VTGSLKENRKSLDITTDKGRANQSALDAIAQSAEAASAAIYSQTGSQDEATNAMQRGRDELIKALEQYGITGQAAQDYADKIIGTPTDWSTTFRAETGEAGQAAEDLKNKILSIPSGKTVSIVAETAAAQGDLDRFIMRNNGRVISVRQQLVQDAIKGGAAPGIAKSAYASGGRIVGPGTGTSDQVPIWASNNEWVIRERAASMYGPKIMGALNDGVIPKHQLMAALSGAPRYASGGPVSAPVRYAPPAQQVVVVQGGGSSGGSSAEINIYPQRGQSEREIGRAAMDEWNWQARRG